MMKKYEFTDETFKTAVGTVLHRIKALRDFGSVKAGDLGGFIEKESNLSHDGNAWIYDDAEVRSDACVSGNARVYDNAEIYGGAKVFGNAWVSGGARVYGDACVYGDARVYGGARVYDDACVYGDARVYGDAWIYGNAEVYGDAEICDNADYLCFKGLGSANRHTTVFRCRDGHIHVRCGCFSGNPAEFEAKVRETHGDSRYAKEYLACIEVIKIHFGINESQ